MKCCYYTNLLDHSCKPSYYRGITVVVKTVSSVYCSRCPRNNGNITTFFCCVCPHIIAAITEVTAVIPVLAVIVSLSIAVIKAAARRHCDCHISEVTCSSDVVSVETVG